MPTIRKVPDGPEFDCAEGDTVLRAALRAGIGMPYSCNTGSCGNCRFELVEGQVRHIRSDPPAWGERDLKRNRWLGCQAAPVGDCAVKFRAMDSYLPPHRPTTRAAQLVSVIPVTHDISEFTFEAEGSGDFSPGQYALFHLSGVEGPRAYSMSNTAGDGQWRFMIRRTPGGAATGWLFGAKPGAGLVMDGPYGNAYLRDDVPRDLVLLAGGSGLSPMISIARGAREAGLLDGRKLHFFYGCRTRADLCDTGVLGPDLEGCVAFTAALSEPDENWDGPSGFLHDVAREVMGERLKACELYFAGPAVMSAAVQKMAYEAGVPADQIHFDEFY